MKKKMSKVLIACLLIGSIAGITPAMATSIPEVPVVASGDGTVRPMADQFTTYYRIYNGVNQYRIWNVTQGYWVMPWTNC